MSSSSSSTIQPNSHEKRADEEEEIELLCYPMRFIV